MIDPSINLKRLLKGQEEALWAVRVDEETHGKARRASIRGTCLWIAILVGFLAYTVYINQGPLFRSEQVGPVPSGVFVAVFLVFAAGIIWLIWYIWRGLKADLIEEKPSIYLITTKRLVATDVDYLPTFSVNVEEIEHVLTVGSKNEELFVSRKNDTDLETAFYMTNVPELTSVKAIIEKLIPKGQTQ